MEGLGTSLRKLVEALDSGVQAHYDAHGSAFRARFYPVARLLLSDGPRSIRAIATASGVSHSAISQTVTEMRKAGLVFTSPSQDGRERLVGLTEAGRENCDRLQPLWLAVDRAAAALDDELSMPLGKLIQEASRQLHAEDFASRIARQLERKVVS